MSGGTRRDERIQWLGPCCCCCWCLWPETSVTGNLPIEARVHQLVVARDWHGAMRSGVTVTDVFTVGVEDAGDDSSQSAEVDAVSLSVLSSAVAAQNKKSSSETVCCVLCAVCAVCCVCFSPCLLSTEVRVSACTGMPDSAVCAVLRYFCCSVCSVQCAVCTSVQFCTEQWVMCIVHCLVDGLVDTLCCPLLPNTSRLHTAQWQCGPPPPMPLLHGASPQEILAKRTLRHHREQHPMLHLTLVPFFITKHCVIYFHIMTFPSCLSSPSLLVDLDFGFSKKVLSCLPQSFAGNKKPAQLTKVGALLLKVAESFFWRKPQTTVQCWVDLLLLLF